ncbi:MAG: glycosyltransferase [Steroidobacteraceae bacterium]
MHVVYVSDVYFPRVNGVSTSIRAFRADLVAAGVETTLVAPDYGPGQASADADGIVRVPYRPLLLYVGRVAHEKNIGFLLRMHALLLARRPDALLVIAGEGPARESLLRLATELGTSRDVRFIGYLDRDGELPDCYAACDVFVFASRTETQGLVLLEAMAQGAPVAALSPARTPRAGRPP